jgi:hypothetical protein
MPMETTTVIFIDNKKGSPKELPYALQIRLAYRRDNQT